MPDADAVPPTLPDHVDAWWDALVRGAPPAADSLASELTAEVRRLHAADRTPHADPAFLARLQEELTMTPTAPLAAPPLRPRGFAPTANGHLPLASSAPRRIAPAARRRWWGAVERLVAAVLVFGLIGGYLALQGSAPPSGNDAPAAQLFHVGGDGGLLTPLDPETLATLPDAPLVTVPGPRVTEGSDWGDLTSRWTLSPDGSTLVSVEYPITRDGFFSVGEMTVVVRDGLTGPERARFDPPELILPEVEPSANGDRILAERASIEPSDGFPVATDPRQWYVLDAESGRPLATISAGEPDPVGGPWMAWFAPDGKRVFRLGASGPPSDAGPSALRLYGYDADTGEEVDRLDLPDVPADVSRTSLTVDGELGGGNASMALARSMDGRHLAVVHDGGTAVTLVDMRRFEIEDTVALQRPLRSGSPSLGPAATQGVRESEPAVSSESWQATWAAFAANGRGVYVGGQQFKEGPTGALSCRDLGVRRVDLQTGAVVGPIDLPGSSSPVVVSPNGESIYSLGPNVEDKCFVPAEAGSVLRRLDPDTLDILAERELTGHPSIELIPRLPGGW